MKKIVRIAVPLLLVVGAGFGVVKWRGAERAMTYAGTVEATEVDVSARVAAALRTMAVEEGEAVLPDQVLAVLEGDDLRLAKTQADADYARALQLYEAGSQPKEMLDRLKTQKDLADVRVAWCTIKAPLAGTVLTRYHEPGEWVMPGAKLYTIGDLRRVWCVVYVPQPLVVRLAPGQKVKALLPEQPGVVFEGVVRHLNDQAEFTPKNVQTRTERVRLVYGVKVEFENSKMALKPGMTLEVSLPE